VRRDVVREENTIGSPFDPRELTLGEEDGWRRIPCVKPTPRTLDTNPLGHRAGKAVKAPDRCFGDRAGTAGAASAKAPQCASTHASCGLELFVRQAEQLLDNAHGLIEVGSRL
jgi:hypothetical protein